MLSRTLNNSIKEISPIGGVLVFGSATTHLRFRATGKTGSPFFIKDNQKEGDNWQSCGGRITRLSGYSENAVCAEVENLDSRSAELVEGYPNRERGGLGTGFSALNHWRPPLFIFNYNGSYDSFLSLKSSKEQLKENKGNHTADAKAGLKEFTGQRRFYNFVRTCAGVATPHPFFHYSINGYRNTPDLLKIGRTSVRCDSDTTTPLKQLRKFSIIGAILSDLANKAYCVAVFYSTHDLKGI